jgi:hypothetical protein
MVLPSNDGNYHPLTIPYLGYLKNIYEIEVHHLTFCGEWLCHFFVLINKQSKLG